MNSVREAKLTDREKVVEKLQAIDAYFRESFNAMDGTLACEQFREWSNAAEDAIALLKAQEPRVMTLEEVENAIDTVAWEEEEDIVGNDRAHYVLIESYSRKAKKIWINFVGTIFAVDGDYDSYGKTWRLWTSKPDKATREATPWP